MLTDTAGVFTADPRRDDEASLIEEIVEIDAALEQVVGRRRHRARERRDGEQARGGEDRGVVGRARGDRVGCRFPASSPTRWPVGRSARRSRRVRSGWRAASSGSRSRARSEGTDRGRRRRAARARRGRQVAARRPECAMSRATSTPTRRSRSSTTDGAVFAKGLCRYTSRQLESYRGRRTADLARGLPPRGRPPRRPRRAARSGRSQAIRAASEESVGRCSRSVCSRRGWGVLGGFWACDSLAGSSPRSKFFFVYRGFLGLTVSPPLYCSAHGYCVFDSHFCGGCARDRRVLCGVGREDRSRRGAVV